MIEPAYILDANICVYLLGGEAPTLLAKIQDQEIGRVATSAIAYAEVLIGAGRRNAIEAAEKFFEAIPVLPFDQQAGARYSHLPFKRGGFDRLIAAHALSLDLTLVTNNERDFLDIPGLRVENWTRWQIGASPPKRL